MSVFEVLALLVGCYVGTGLYRIASAIEGGRK